LTYYSCTTVHLMLVYQLLAHGQWFSPGTPASSTTNKLLAHDRWFSPGTPASSTTKIGRHDIAEILLKVALNTHFYSFFFNSYY